VERLTALGNAVVPQIPEVIGRAILEFEGTRSTRNPIPISNQKPEDGGESPAASRIPCGTGAAPP
jgi:hypothetical protein